MEDTRTEYQIRKDELAKKIEDALHQEWLNANGRC